MESFIFEVGGRAGGWVEKNDFLKYSRESVGCSFIRFLGTSEVAFHGSLACSQVLFKAPIYEDGSLNKKLI